MSKFWNWIRDADTGGRVLRLEGPIDEDDVWGDAVTPLAFRQELESDSGDITVWINSPGGSVFAAAEIYTMLRDYSGSVTVRIASVAASAASVVAMAGDVVQMSPTALLMIHDPMTIAMGNTRDMEKAIATLNQVKESIINAYIAKTGLSHNRISKLMEDESWINAKEAVKLGFADEILFENKKVDPDEEEPDENDPDTEEDDDDEKEEKIKLEAGMSEAFSYSTRIMGQTILNRIKGPIAVGQADAKTQGPAENGVKDKDSEEVEEITSGEECDPKNDTEESPKEETSPVIGMDGKTKDGSMPFELLRNQLEFLR